MTAASAEGRVSGLPTAPGMTGSGLTILTVVGAVCGAVSGVVLGAGSGASYPHASGMLGALIGGASAAGLWVAAEAAIRSLLSNLSTVREGAIDSGWDRAPGRFALAGEYYLPAENQAVGEGRDFANRGMYAGRQFAELDEMRSDFLRMSSGVEGALSEAVRAVLDRDPELAARVIAGEEIVDELDGRLEDQCYRILLLYHPVAGDLRLVTAVAHMSAELERLGDLAVGIARRAVLLAELPDLPAPGGLRAMAGSAVELVRAALASYLKRDPASARSVCRAREAVVRSEQALTGELVAAMKADSRAVESALHLLGVVQSLRRVADRATNLAEDAVFLAEGRRIRHHWDPDCHASVGGIAG